MEMREHRGRCDRDTFWKVVAEIDWQGRCDQVAREPWRSVEAEVATKWDAAFLREFRSHLDEVCGALRERMMGWGREDAIRVSDDGMSDLVAHVVGCGREVYDETMNDPWQAVFRVDEDRYRENFRYCFC